NGVYLGGLTCVSNIIEGNLIGTDTTGSQPLPNFNGIGIANAPYNIIGGVLAGNVISANTESGIYVLGASATANIIQGNFIGTDARGSNALGNGMGAIYLYGSPGNLIGGKTPGAGNLMSGNANVAVSIGDPGSVSNVLQGNFLGTQADGVSPLGN